MRLHSSSSSFRFIVAGIWAAIFCSAAQAMIIYVDDSALSGANNGTSWTDAVLDLHDALAIARAGDEIRIGQGTYKPAAPGSGDRDATFTLVNGVLMQGGFAGTGAVNPNEYDPKKFPTILSGDLNGDDAPNFQNYDENSYNVMFADGIASQTTLRGLIISNGNADFYVYGAIDRREYGGGISGMNGASLTVVDSIIRDNRTHFGGGGGIRIAGIQLVRSRFINNQADFFALTGAGALAIGGAPSQIVDCVFQANSAGSNGGAILHYDPVGVPLIVKRCRFISNYCNEAVGAISSSSCIIIDTDFIGNNGYDGVGALGCEKSTIVNCRFLNNGGHCFENGSALQMRGSVRVINCLFSGNVGSYSTVGVAWSSTVPNLISNCTFVGNRSGCAGAAIDASAATVVANNIVWNNQFASWPPNSVQANQISIPPGSLLAHNLIQGWDGTLGGVNNSGVKPEFIDADGPDNEYGTEDDNPRLHDLSPARDTGDNAFLPKDEFDLDGDGNTTELLPVDLDNLRRIVNGTVDIGAYEWQRPPTCQADIDPSRPGIAGDGQINVNDLLVVIQSWGECDQCVADITNDGNVNIDDLLQVISAWGACP